MSEKILSWDNYFVDGGSHAVIREHNPSDRTESKIVWERTCRTEANVVSAQEAAHQRLVKEPSVFVSKGPSESGEA